MNVTSNHDRSEPNPPWEEGDVDRHEYQEHRFSSIVLQCNKIISVIHPLNPIYVC